MKLIYVGAAPAVTKSEYIVRWAWSLPKISTL